MDIISTNSAPKAIGPYSQAIAVGNLIYTSGQIPLDAQTNELITNDITRATSKVLDNILAILKEAGSDLSKVVKANIFLTDMNNFAQVNEVYAKYFKEHLPVRSCVQVSRLPKDVQIEIEVVAIRP